MATRNHQPVKVNIPPKSRSSPKVHQGLGLGEPGCVSTSQTSSGRPKKSMGRPSKSAGSNICFAAHAWWPSKVTNFGAQKVQTRDWFKWHGDNVIMQDQGNPATKGYKNDWWMSMIVHEHCETAGSHAVRKHGIGPRGWPNNPGPADTAPYDLVEHVVGSLLQRRSGDWRAVSLIRRWT